MLPHYTMTQPKGLTSVLKWEANPDFSRESAVLLAGSGAVRTIAVGMIVAMLATASATTASVAADAGNTGNGVMTMSTPAVTSAVKEGIYKVVCTDPATNGGTFEVTDPNGDSVGTAKVGTAFTKQVRFTIADGGNDFAAGDRFEITVTGADINPNAGKAVAWDPTASDGSEVPWGIAATAAEALDGVDLDIGLVVLRRDALCFANGIVWPDGVTDAQKAVALQDLEKQGIVVRTT